MRLRIESTPAEMQTKADELLKALAERFRPLNEDFAERLEKALPPKEPSLKYPALRHIADVWRREYERQVKAMADSIGEILQRGVAAAGGGSRKAQARATARKARTGGDDRALVKAGEYELPEALGMQLWDILEKGAGHKYIRRIPTGNPKRPWRYYYDVTSGAGLGGKGEMLVGSKFQIKAGEHAGHYEILATEGGRLKLKHDESGKTVEMTTAELRAALHKEHAKAIEHKITERLEELWRVRLYGTEKQVQKLEKEWGKLRELFPKLAREWYPEPSSSAPPGASQDYHAMVDALHLMRGLSFSFVKQERALGPRPVEEVRVGKAMQQDMAQLKKYLSELTGYDFSLNPTTDQSQKQRKEIDKRIQRVMGPAAASGFGYLSKLFAEAETGVISSRLMSGAASAFSDVVPYFEFQQAKQDLALDASEPLSVEVAIVQGKFAQTLREGYFKEGRGTRTAFKTLTDMVGTMRTQRGLAAMQQLVSPVYNKGAHSVEAMRSLLGWGMGDVLEKAKRVAQRNRELGYTTLTTDIDKSVPAVAQAIKDDQKYVLGELDRLKSEGRSISELTNNLYSLNASAPDIQRVETTGDLLSHRFNHIPPQQSAVGKLFRDRFNATVYLDEESFEGMLETEVTDKDYERVNLKYVQESEEKKVLQKLKPETRALAKRYFALRKAGFGYHAGVDEIGWKSANKGEKSAYNEVKHAIDVSRQAKERALHALYHALDDMEKALGVPVDLSGLPLVLSDRHVGAMANAHYMPALGPNAYDNIGADKKWSDLTYKPHIALHTGFEKSLAHELMHYMDNRVTLRHINKREQPGNWADDGIETFARKQGMPADYELTPAVWLAEQSPDYEAAQRQLNDVFWKGKGIKYTSNMASFFVRAQDMPVFQTDKGKALLTHIRNEWLKLPGSQALLELHQELKAVGAYEAYAKLDGDGSATSLDRMLSEITGQEAPSGEQALYYQAGTEVTARITEQFIHAKMAKQGKLNPSLTHVTYDKDSTPETPGQYVDPEVFEKRIAPKFQKVLDFYAENMTKALLEEDEALLKAAGHKYIRRIPTGNPKRPWKYVYRASAAAHARQAQVGEKIRLKEGDQEGHYEVTAAHPGDWVTLKHDETGHEVTVKQDWVKQLYLKEYQEQHASDRARLARTYEAAQQYGSKNQIERARKNLARHMEQFPAPEARAAELRAAHAHTQAETLGTDHAQLTAATAHLESLDRGARGGKDQLAKAKSHIDAVKVKKPRKRGTGKPKKPGDFGSKAWSYGAITESVETSADFSAADAAYRAWKGESERGGPKPPPWQGGELDAVNRYLETKVSSPREAWDRLTVGVKRWDDPRVVEAMDIMREIPGYEDARLPDEVIEWLQQQAIEEYERAAQDEFEEGFSEDAFEFNFGFAAEPSKEAFASSLSPGGLEKAGPFIGPRGGKWADAKHTIPWQEGADKQSSKDESKHVEFKLKVHPKIGRGGERKVLAAPKGKDEVVLSVGGPLDKDRGIVMPKASVKHFLNDLAGKVDVPKTDNKAVNAVIEGEAEVLGKGDDGLVFKVGDQVVKVSTTVPFIPENRGHRTPREAIEMLREQAEVGNKLADKGIEGVQRSEFVVSGDKGFQIKPYVEIPDKFTRAQLDAIQDTLIAIHNAGYAVNDQIQAGLQDGKPVMFDVGKASKLEPDTKRDGPYSPITADMEAMDMLYRDHGETFVRRDTSKGQQALQKVNREFEKLLPISGGKLVHRQVVNAVNLRAKELKATLEGKALDDALDDLDSDVWHMRVTLEDEGLEVPTFGPAEAEEAEKSGSLEKAAPFIGPRGGKWADPQHTIPWQEPTDRPAPGAKPKRQKHLFHTTGYHRMEQIKEQGLKPRQGSGTYEHGAYAAHSQGKVFLAAHHSAASEWADKVHDQLRDQSDKTHERIPVMLRITHRKTKKDQVGSEDIAGSRYATESIPPEEIEFYHPKKGWLPVAQWGEDTGTEHAIADRDEHGEYVHDAGEGGYTPTSSKHANKPSEATEKHRAALAAKQQQAETQRQAKQAQQAKQAEQAQSKKNEILAKEQAKWVGKKRQDKISELLAQKKRSPIPGVEATGLDTSVEVDGEHLPWRQILRVNRKGEDLAKALPDPGDLAKAGPFIGPRGGKWADPQHTIPWRPEVTRGESLHHGSHRGVFTPHMGLCLTDDEDVAKKYAAQGEMYTVTVDLSKLRVVELEQGYDRDTNEAPGDRDPEGTGKEHGADIIVFDDEDENGNEHRTWRIVSQAGLDAITDANVVEKAGLVKRFYVIKRDRQSIKKSTDFIPGAEDTYEDHTAPIAEKDATAYKRVKMHLIRRGYRLEDFEQGGPLYGMSTNELIELARERKD